MRRDAAEGVILLVQERMIKREFDYADRLTRDAMTPQMEIISLAADTSTQSGLIIT